MVHRHSSLPAASAPSSRGLWRNRLRAICSTSRLRATYTGWVIQLFGCIPALVKSCLNAARVIERSARNRTAGESVMHWLFPLHSGSAFGMAGKIAMCLTGLAMLLMFPTGLWVWWLKRRAATFEPTRRTRPRGQRTDAPSGNARQGALE